MSPQPELSPALTLTGQSPVLHAFGEVAHVLLSGEQTGGKFAMILEITPPGGGPPPHWHDHEDETFYVLEGRVSFLANDSWTEVAPGAAAFLPKGSVHTFKNIGATPLKMILQVAPAGFEVFFARCAAEFAKPGGPDMAEVMAVAAAHGIHFQMP